MVLLILQIINQVHAFLMLPIEVRLCLPTINMILFHMLRCHLRHSILVRDLNMKTFEPKFPLKSVYFDLIDEREFYRLGLRIYYLPFYLNQFRVVHYWKPHPDNLNMIPFQSFYRILSVCHF